jgi:hypothetical protein
VGKVLKIVVPLPWQSSFGSGSSAFAMVKAILAAVVPLPWQRQY